MKTEGRKRVKIEGDVPDLPPKLEYIIRRLIWFGAHILQPKPQTRQVYRVHSDNLHQ